MSETKIAQKIIINDQEDIDILGCAMAIALVVLEPKTTMTTMVALGMRDPEAANVLRTAVGALGQDSTGKVSVDKLLESIGRLRTLTGIVHSRMSGVIDA